MISDRGKLRNGRAEDPLSAVSETVFLRQTGSIVWAMPKKTPEPPAPDVPAPDVNEQSGSTGRNPGPPREKPGQDGKPGTGENTGQGNYGQSGYGQFGYGKDPGKGGGGDNRTSYQRDEPGRKKPGAGGSNLGADTKPAGKGSREKGEP